MRISTHWRRILLWIFGGMLTTQAILISALSIIAELRKRRNPPASFPHERRLSNLVNQQELRIYTNGQALYDAMIAAIDQAKESIYLESFIWKGDEIGALFKERLARKADEGVAVYVIFDSFANLVVPRHFKRFPANVHTLKYRSLTRVWYALDPRRYARDHRKLMVVDQEIAFVGGFNIGKLYATQWRDTHLRIKGPAARDIAASFIDFWNNNSKEPMPSSQLAERPWPEHITIHVNDPARLVFPIRGMYLEGINRAQHHIYLTNAYFIPDRVVLSALIAAAERGVDVRILLPWNSNHVLADWLARANFTRCLEAGIKLFGYQKAMIHAKTATIDGIWSTIGTANLDRLSLAGNYEINVAIRDADFAADMEHVFMHDLENAVQITLEDWLQRPWYVRLGEWLLRPLRPLI